MEADIPQPIDQEERTSPHLFTVLAAAATNDGEVFKLLGAGVEKLRVHQLPAVTLLHLVARWSSVRTKAGSSRSG